MPRDLPRELNETGQSRADQANDLEGQQDMGGKQGGQVGVPKPPPLPRQGESDSDVPPKRPSGDRGR
jgi:hypothetical protein